MIPVTRRQAITALPVLSAGLLIALPSLLSEKLRALLFGAPPSATTKLGLDLKGGSNLVLEVDTSQGQPIEEVKEVVRRRFGDIASRELTIVPKNGN
jgi:preprotein translocase subunit SecD